MSESGMSERQLKNQRNSANNAEAVRAAADIAAKTNNPYAKAIGKGIQTADKISGGKASEKLGKKLNTMNKMAGLKGKLLQAGLNKMAESGTTDRINKAVNAKNSGKGNSPKMNGVGGAASKAATNTVKDKSETSSNDSGTSTFSGDFKVVKYGLIGLVALFPIIFCCLFISSSQIYLNTISLGTADSLNDAEVDKKINKKMQESPKEFDSEIKDEDLEAFNYDIYITDSKSQILKSQKLYDTNIVQVADIFTFFKRKYNEATLDRIEEFFPAVVDENKNYDENMVYDFYYKMYNLYTEYRAKYRVRLDLPLLMATLNLQSQDKNVVFSSNMDSRYRTNSVNDIPKDELDYYYDWSDYKLSKNNSEHDMEILAQHMVSKQVKEKCKNSSGKVVNENILKDDQIGTKTLVCNEDETYEIEELGFVVDNDKYKEFLKQFLERKYFLEEESSIIESNGSSSSSGDTTQICSLTVKENKYYKVVNPQTEECYVPGFYDNNSWGLEPTFYNNLLALINDGKSQGCSAAIISGHRTYAKQAYLYNCYITKKCNNGNLADKPGYSNYEYGLAADLSYYPRTSECLNFYHTNASKYGLTYPLLNASNPEDWYIEPVNIIEGRP